MKKVLALVLAFAMMFSTITVAFAEPEVSAEAKALATVGMLEGDGNGVTAEYTAKEMTRFTAAISLLKLKGLYNDALAFKADANFADVDAVKWEEGKNILAYLKANPGLGFGGNEKGEFNPNGNINEQSYYKVLLETLGYKQTTAEVAGDFAWEEVLTFAESIGLKPAKAEKFTVDELAKATVAALKTNVKEGKALINVLVESGKVDKAKAVAAELMTDAVLEAALKSAKAIGNTVVEVEFDAEINEGATDVALYSIEGLEVKSAVIDGTKKVLLETSAQSSGKTYTLVVGEVKVNFGGKAKVAGAPELKKVTGTDTDRVELEFDKVLDFETATDVANYTIANITIAKAALNSDKTKVTLTTEGLAANKTYTVKVTGVKSVDGAALKSASKSFYSKSDKVAPKIEKAEALTYTRVLVKFNEELDKESAENIDNYTIDKLTIEKAVLVEDPDDEEDQWIELTTSAQKGGTSYTVKVKGVKDTSVLGNEMVKEASVRFTGKAQDKTGPTVKSTEVLNRNRVLVEFNDASRLDFATVQDVNNYEFNKDVAVEKAELIPDYNDDTKAVILTVSDMADKTTYKLTIAGVADEYGNEIKKAEKSINYNNTKLDASRITGVVAKSSTKIDVKFSKYIDPVTAKDVANYSLNKEIGTPVAAKVSDDLKKVTLTINELTEGVTYKVTVDGIEDLAGNTLKTNASFVALTTENDIEAPEVEDITVVNRKVMRVTFSEPIKVKGINVTATIKEVDKTANINLNLGAVYEDNKVLEFTKADEFKDVEYELTGLANVADKAGNKAVVADEITFWGDNSVEEKLDFSWEQVNVAKYRLTFSEKVQLKAADSNYEDDDKDDLGMDTVWYLKKKVAIDKDAFKGDINNKFETRHGIKINNTDDDKAGETRITASMEDTDAPYIESVEAEYRNKVRITFNEDIQSYGKYEISYYDAAGKLKKVTGISGSQDADNDNGVILNLTNLSLESRFDYTLKVATPVQDLANNKSEKDEEYDFPGTDLVAPDNYILGVEITNAKNFKVKAYSDISAASVKLYYDENDKEIEIIAKKDPAAKKEVSITLLNTALRSGVDYKVVVGSMEYVFEGTAADSITFYDDGAQTVVTYNDMKSTDKVIVNNKLAGPTFDSEGAVEDFRVVLGTDAAGKNLPVKTIIVERDGVTLYFFVEDGEDATIDAPDSIGNEASLLAAIADKNVKSIKLVDNVTLTAALTIDRLVNVDLGGKKIDGDVSVISTEIGKMTIKNGTIDGDLTVEVPNADFVVADNATVTGTTTIKDVKSNTFYNYGTLNSVVVAATKAVTLVNVGTLADVTINSTNAVTIDSADDIVITNNSGKKIEVVVNGNTEQLADSETKTVASDDKAVVEQVYAALDLTFASGDTAAAVTKGFTVKVKDEAKEVEIAWESDNEAIEVDADGKVTVTRPEEDDVEVTLTAILTKGLVEIEKVFTFTVKALE